MTRSLMHLLETIEGTLPGQTSFRFESAHDPWPGIGRRSPRIRVCQPQLDIPGTATTVLREIEAMFKGAPTEFAN